jgi:hypothetical protein
MPKPLPTIHESQEELLNLFNAIHDRERRNRVHALFLIKIEHCKTRKAIAETLHVERKAVERWLKQYEQEGLQSLLTSQRSRCGKKPRIQGETVYHTVHYKLKGAPKVPRKSNVRKDPQLEDDFKKKCLRNT